MKKRQVAAYLDITDIVLLEREAARRRMPIADLLRGALAPLLTRLRKRSSITSADSAIADTKRLPGVG